MTIYRHVVDSVVIYHVIVQCILVTCSVSVYETLMVESAKKQYKDVWHHFHVMSVDKLPAIWNEIGSSMGFNMEPILHLEFSQMLTRLLPNQRPPLATSSDVDSRELLAEEEKAIMYTGGFIVRKLRCKYEKINTKTAAEYVEVMTSLLQGGKFDDEEIEIDENKLHTVPDH